MHSPPIFRGSNVIGQINIIINKISYIYFVENPLQIATALKGSYDAFLKIIILCIWCNRIC